MGSQNGVSPHIVAKRKREMGSVRSRKRYAARMELRAGEILEGTPSDAMEEEWRRLRRGWYLGGETFRDRLMDRIDRVVRGRRRASYRSEGMRTHDEREAARLLKDSCKALGVDLPDLRKRRQTDVVKQGIAWYVKSRSTIEDEWICRKLEMGSRTNIYRAVSRYRIAETPSIRNIRKKLELCAD